MQDPVLTFTGNIVENGTIEISEGETLVVTFTVRDETSTDEEIEWYITVMDMKSYYIYSYQGTNQLKFLYKGTFEVKLICRDAAGNYTDKSFTVVVK